MDEFFEDFYNYEGFGPAIQKREVPAVSIAKYKGKLPDKLLEYWQEYGWCGYAKGLFWTVNPEEWDDALDAWIEDTPFMEQDAYHVIARGAFGDLYLWGEKTGPSIHVCPAWGFIFPRFDAEKFARRGPNLALQLFFSAKSRSSIDLKDNKEKFLFERALKSLGPLDHDTMYGFVPVLAVSGEPELHHLQKLDAHVHLEILAQMTERQIMKDIVAIAKASDKE
jgi:hypothetical protein